MVSFHLTGRLWRVLCGMTLYRSDHSTFRLRVVPFALRMRDGVVGGAYYVRYGALEHLLMRSDWILIRVRRLPPLRCIEG